MEINTARAKEIDEWLRGNSDLEVKELKAQVELFGENKYLEVWKIPIKMLIYNIRNGRFQAELLDKEKQLGRRLDANVPEDRKVIQMLLLEQNPKETEELKASLKQYGQLREGIITFDGAVINANRRMAVLTQLREETGDPKFEYLKVARLPKNVSEIDVWRIEAGLQFAKDFLVEYSPVNELLKLREGIKKKLTEKQISHMLMGRFTEDGVKDRLKVLSLIDSYLEYIGQSGEYQLFQKERNVEKFNSLSNNVLEPLKAKKEIPAKEIPQLMQAAFSLIAWKGNDAVDDVSHWEIRKLRDVAKNEKAKATLLSEFKADDLTEKSLIKLVDAYGLAREIAAATKDYEKPKKLAERALVFLEGIDKKSQKLKETEVQEILKKIADLTDQLLKHSKAR